MAKYIYFVSYACISGMTHGFGMSQVSSEKEIITFEQVERMVKDLLKNKQHTDLSITSIIILNFQLLRTEPQSEG